MQAELRRFERKTLRREVSSMGWKNYMTFYTSEYESDRVAKHIDQSDEFSQAKCKQKM
jgi:hypothetical protein